MKRLTAAAALWAIVASCWANQGSVAFYYGPHVPVHELQKFNTVVVEPGFVPNPAKNETKKSRWYAYVSVGEVNPSRD